MTDTLTAASITDRHEFAKEMARRAGDAAARHLRETGPDGLAVSLKGTQDFVTEADRRTEAMIRTAIAEAFPEDGFLGEESGANDGNGLVWVVDPIDGTANYMRGLRSWGVSIALVDNTAILAGAIYDATNDTVFHARAGGGAFAEQTPIKASAVSDPERALAIVGYSRRMPFANHIEVLKKLHDAGLEYRRHGAAALGLLRVADGKAELYHEAHLNSWDAMAGILIAREAGAVVDAPELGSLLLKGGPIRAMAPKLAGLFAAILPPDPV